MKPDWWPPLLRFIAEDDLWAEPKVPVSRLFSIPNDGHHPGEFRSFTVLVPMADFEAVQATPRGLSHEVSANGPHPIDRAAPDYDPSFWVSAYGLPRESYEPLMLSWLSNNRTVLMPDPRFLMTYGLVPRTLSSGRIAYDDPQMPMFDVVEVDSPSIWDSPGRTAAVAKISRDHLQDYLTLRGVALFEVYFGIATGEADEESLKLLAGSRNADFELPDRLINLQHRAFRGDRSLTAQVWGARLIAMPGELPITADPLDKTGLVWPGYASAINTKDAMRLGISDYVYIDDQVLAPYEGKAGFTINPETGSVSFENQWGVGFCDRVGRNTVRLELKKLYEGAPSPIIRNWHAHALAPTASLLSAEARNASNVATRAKDLVMAWADIGASLSAIADSLGLKATAESFVGLDKEKLDYYGWASPTSVEPITRHVPIDVDQASFLQRCIALNNLLAEGIGQASVRKVLETLIAPENVPAKWRGLTLLNEIVCLAQVARSTGLSLIANPDVVREELKASGTDPGRPMENLFALYDLRIVAAHTSSDTARELANRLERFGIEPSDYAGGFGLSLDRVYDELVRELVTIAEVLRGGR